MNLIKTQHHPVVPPTTATTAATTAARTAMSTTKLAAGNAIPPSSAATTTSMDDSKPSKKSNSNSNSNSRKTTTTTTTTMKKKKKNRGAFVVLEGVDRCGKTTQCRMLMERLMKMGMAATLMRFPDRTTPTGQLIDAYLKGSTPAAVTAASQEQPQPSKQISGGVQDDHAIHLLFSANRWESTHTIERHLMEGTTVICDRYAYSGVAFTSAKAKMKESSSSSTTTSSSPESPLSIEWCIGPDRGLPAPDCVLYLDLSPEKAEQRGGYGEERYERRDFQICVRERFMELRQRDEEGCNRRKEDNDDNHKNNNCVPWTVVDASKSITEVEQDVFHIVNETLQRIQQGHVVAVEDGFGGTMEETTITPLRLLWQDGEWEWKYQSSSLSLLENNTNNESSPEPSQQSESPPAGEPTEKENVA